MKILGIETSCDETAAAVVEDGRRILSNVVVSQIDIHKAFGGVVPEVAARSHIEAIIGVVDLAVNQSQESSKGNKFSSLESRLSSQSDPWDQIDAIAVTTHPGLNGSLMIGVLTAEALALIKNKPLYRVNHIEAHVYANFVGENIGNGISNIGLGVGAEIVSKPYIQHSIFNFPMLALVVSGGHTQIMLFHGHGDYEILGQTRDDAVGEAFDKVAKILGLPYPGGPSIAAAAERGNPEKYHLPKAKLDNPLDFSFSGLKTALLRAVQSECGRDYTFPSTELKTLLKPSQRDDFAASFQRVAIETLVDKMCSAFDKYQPKSVVVAGGVAANQELRRLIAERLPIAVHFPAPEFCTDNAAMVAALGYFKS